MYVRYRSARDRESVEACCPCRPRWKTNLSQGGGGSHPPPCGKDGSRPPCNKGEGLPFMAIEGAAPPHLVVEWGGGGRPSPSGNWRGSPTGGGADRAVVRQFVVRMLRIPGVLPLVVDQSQHLTRATIWGAGIKWICAHYF